MNIRWHLSVDITLSHEKAELNVDVVYDYRYKENISYIFDLMEKGQLENDE